MGKRGPKLFEENLANTNLVPVRVISEETGLTINKVRYAFESGMRKLKEGKDFPLILKSLCACTSDERDSLQAGSIECDKRFIEENSILEKENLFF